MSISVARASADEFGELSAPYRQALLVHCYRMLGSIDDAEDAVQETFVRAWRGRATFAQAVSFQAWLYRIATNVCLDAIERRKRAWGSAGRAEVQPVPDDLLEEPSAGPEARYDARESISLAFLTALQVLSPRQRGVLILRDVLGWRAAEVADLLGLSVPAANSALHRARLALAAAYTPAGVARPIEPGRLRSLLDRYVRAWEAADVAGLVSLLREDAVVAMPPALTIQGAEAIATFLAQSVFGGGRVVRLTPVPANGVPAFVIRSGADDATLEPYAILALGIEAGRGDAGTGADRSAASERVVRMSVFAEPRLVARFLT